MRVGSACTGWATESQALSQLEIPHEMIFMCDSEPDVEKFLQMNVQCTRFHQNVFERGFLDEEPVDLLVAGAPCQPYSSDGKRLGSADPRSKVIFPITSYIERARPLMILLENVPGWATVGRDNFEEVWARLSNIRASSGDSFYNLYQARLDSSDYGSLQNRKRLYVVAMARSLDSGFAFPEPLPDRLPFDSILDPGSCLHHTFTVEDVPPEMLQTKTRQRAMVAALALTTESVPCGHMVVDLGSGRDQKITKDRFPTITANRCRNRDFFSVQMRRRFSLAELARAQGADPAGLNMSAVSPAAMGHIIGNAMTVSTMKAILSQMLTCAGLRS